MSLASSVAYSVFGQDPAWRSFPCDSSTIQWRFLSDGTVEVDGSGAVKGGWPTKVDQWQELIAAAAIKWGVPAAWIASVMSIESGGDTNACYRPVLGGPCSTDDGFGLMAIKAQTATGIEKRTVTPQELMDNPALNIDLGTKYLRGHLDDANCTTCKPIAGDFVKASIGYNAGGIHCASTTSGKTIESRETCPPTGWGVIMGCTLQPRDIGGCEPSTSVPGKYKCPNMYPMVFIKAVNAAIARGWGDLPPGYDPNYVPPSPSPMDQLAPPSRFLWLVGAGVAGYLGMLYLPKLLRRRLAYR